MKVEKVKSFQEIFILQWCHQTLALQSTRTPIFVGTQAKALEVCAEI